MLKNIDKSISDQIEHEVLDLCDCYRLTYPRREINVHQTAYAILELVHHLERRNIGRLRFLG